MGKFWKKCQMRLSDESKTEFVFVLLLVAVLIIAGVIAAAVVNIGFILMIGAVAAHFSLFNVVLEVYEVPKKFIGYYYSHIVLPPIFVGLSELYLHFRYNGEFTPERVIWELIVTVLLALYWILYCDSLKHDDDEIAPYMIVYCVLTFIGFVIFADTAYLNEKNYAVSLWVVSEDTEMIPLTFEHSPNPEDYIPIGQLKVGEILRPLYRYTKDFQQDTIIVQCDEKVGRVRIKDIEPFEYEPANLAHMDKLGVVHIPRWIMQDVTHPQPQFFDIERYIKDSWYALYPMEGAPAYDVDYYPIGSRIGDDFYYGISYEPNRLVKGGVDKSRMTITYRFTYKDTEDNDQPWVTYGKIKMNYNFNTNKWYMTENDLEKEFVYLGYYNIDEGFRIQSNYFKDYISTFDWEVPQ